MYYRLIDLHFVTEYYDAMYTNILLLLKVKIKYNNDMYILDITLVLHMFLQVFKYKFEFIKVFVVIFFFT